MRVETGSRARVVLADDNEDVLARVTSMLGTKFDIVQCVRDGASAVEAVGTLDPDIVILDISMPGMSGIQAALRLKDRGSRALVIFLTVHGDADYVREAFRVGAWGYVLKSCLIPDLLDAIHAVQTGNSFVSPSLRINPPARPV